MTIILLSCDYHVQLQKARKKQQKLDKQQQKDAEREAQRRAVAYAMMLQDTLNSVDNEAKENFRTGSEGAVVSLHLTCHTCTCR